METIFDAQNIENFKDRIGRIEEYATASWGKMNIKQMLVHVIENEKLLLRERDFKDVFIGKLFGQMALKSDVKNDKPFGKNSPTHPDLKIKVSVDMDISDLKSDWKAQLDKYLKISHNHYDDFKHPFFRKMSYEQVGIWAYKHIDHHLRQFGY